MISELSTVHVCMFERFVLLQCTHMQETVLQLKKRPGTFDHTNKNMKVKNQKNENK